MGIDRHGRRIRELPVSLANQIAAGEVVERPASVAKELLENSLDAAARWIDVDVEQGGVRLIRVRDDGSGIHRDDLALALRRHATSKITSLAELEQVASLGFRGEALPSIASVSRLALSSRCRPEDHGWRVTADGRGEFPALVPMAQPFGTTVEVRDLFFTTPARRKFLRSERTEQRHIQQLVKRTALSRFDVGFRLQCDGASMLRLSPAVSARARSQRLAKVCGSGFAQHALAIDFEAAGLRLTGWVADPGFSRGAADLQHLFVNGRWVRDGLVAHALRQAYQDRLTHGRYPAYVLYVEIDPRAVDVNVHPTKQEIRFRERRLVHDFLVRSVARALAGAPTEAAYAPALPQRSRAGLVSTPHHTDEGGAAANPDAGEGRSQRNAQAMGCRPSWGIGEGVVEGTKVGAPKGMPPLGYALGVLRSGSYLLAENAEGLVLVDRRRALDQVILKQLLGVYRAGCMVARPLLLPLALTVSADEARVIQTSEMTLKSFGFDLRCISPGTLSVRRIPSFVQGADLSNLVHELLAALMLGQGGDEGSGETNGIFRVMATHAAAGAEPPRTLADMNALLREIEAVGLGLGGNSFGWCWVQLSVDEIKGLFWRDCIPDCCNRAQSGS